MSPENWKTSPGFLPNRTQVCNLSTSPARTTRHLLDSSRGEFIRMKRAIKFNGFTPVLSAYESGALLPDKESVDGLCKAIDDLSSGWTVEEVKLAAKSYWKVVWLGK